MNLVTYFNLSFVDLFTLYSDHLTTPKDHQQTAKRLHDGIVSQSREARGNRARGRRLGKLGSSVLLTKHPVTVSVVRFVGKPQHR